MTDRDLDVVVFGATGVTGRLVAAYLAAREGEHRWAAAGRNPGRVETTLAGAGVEAPEVIAADAGDARSLAAMAARARVVLDLVGPYTRFGRPVIEACIGAGAHYADLSGEMPFLRRVIEECDARAAGAGVKLVQVCGFEALPFDLAVLLAAEAARERHGEDLAEIDVEVTAEAPPGLPRPSDLLSGGTFQSMAEIAASDGAEAVADSAALIRDSDRAEKVRGLSPIAIAPRRGTGGAVVAPMLPAAFINPAVIHRTAALLAAEAGDGPPPFRYREGVALGGSEATLPLRYGLAGALSGLQVSIRGLTRARPAVRRRAGDALRRVLPDSGFGPGDERLEGWSWRLAAAGRTVGGHRVEARVDADGHPGYLTTARMLGEAGLVLAEPGLTPERAGCLTPAAAIGTGPLERFASAGVRFRVA